MKKFVAGAVLSVLLLTGCGGSSSSGYDTPQDMAKKLNCSYEGGSEELFVKEGGPCGDYDLYTFNDNEGRDNWVKAASSFGGNYVVGDKWVVMTDTGALAKKAQKTLGGDIK